MYQTSPLPPGRNRRLIVALVVIVVLMALGTWWSTTTTAPEDAAPTTRTPTLGTTRSMDQSAAINPRPTVLSATLARAVAAVGAYDDGRRASLDDLPAEVQALIDQARVLLGTTPRVTAPGLPMVLPDGTVAGMKPDPAPRVPLTTTPVETHNDAPTPADRERARAIDGRLVARTLTSNGKTPPPSRGDRVKEILEPDAWMAVPYNPTLTAGEPLVLTNRSLGEYVLRIETDDYGSVRLNGGLVVPGRFYLMQGTMTISGDVPVGVMIRPLGVVHGYYDQPVRPPSANG